MSAPPGGPTPPKIPDEKTSATSWILVAVAVVVGVVVLIGGICALVFFSSGTF